MPMRLQSVVLVLAVSVSAPMTAMAGEDEFFAGLDLLGGVASGSSSTRDGGAPFAGGGVVDEVRFGGTTGIGGHMGYRFAPDLAVSISYQHIRGDIGWNANFPLYGVSSGFEGTATSDAVIGSIAYETPLSDATVVRGTAGLGISFNSLSGVGETGPGIGAFPRRCGGSHEDQPLGAGRSRSPAQDHAQRRARLRRSLCVFRRI